MDVSMSLADLMRVCSGMGGKGAAGGWVIVGSQGLLLGELGAYREFHWSALASLSK